jgi:hypothetical protein
MNGLSVSLERLGLNVTDAAKKLGRQPQAALRRDERTLRNLNPKWRPPARTFRGRSRYLVSPTNRI